MAKRQKKAADAVLDPSVVLKKPKCRKCGYQNPKNCVAGAGCPKCGTRFTKGKARNNGES